MKIISLTKEEISLAGKIIQEEFNKPPYNDSWNKNSVEKMLAHSIKIGKGFVLKEKGETIVDKPFRKIFKKTKSENGLSLHF